MTAAQLLAEAMNSQSAAIVVLAGAVIIHALATVYAAWIGGRR